MQYEGDSNDYSAGRNHALIGGHFSDIPDGAARAGAIGALNERMFAEQRAAQAASSSASSSIFGSSSNSSGFSNGSSSSNYVMGYAGGYASASSTTSSDDSGGGLILLAIAGFALICFLGSGNHDPSNAPQEKNNVAAQPPAPVEQPMSAQDAPATVPTEPPIAARTSPPQFARAPQSPPPPAPPVVANPAAMAQYESAILKATKDAIIYPPSALADSEDGACQVRLRVGRDGTILSTTLLSGTGFHDLDRECHEVFSRIGSFPPAPEEARPSDREFVLDLPVTFTLSDS